MKLKETLLLLGLIGIMACEEVIDVDLQDAEPILVVDAWINNRIGENQIILLTTTLPYFSESVQPTISGASVTITDELGNNFVFNEVESGRYEWRPSIAQPTIGVEGTSFELSVLVNGSSYTSMTTMGRVPEIDSISIEQEEQSAFISIDDFYIAQFWATDLVGPGDAYWIKTVKNGVPLNKPSEISLAFDSGTTQGGNFDGVPFILPIRQSINPLEVDENDLFLSPYLPGDSVYVEIHSISVEAFQFLTEVRLATDRPGGFGELFSSPLSNVPTNIKNTNTAIEGDVIGYFNVASVSGLGKRFEQS